MGRLERSAPLLSWFCCGGGEGGGGGGVTVAGKEAGKEAAGTGTEGEGARVFLKTRVHG